MLADGHAVELAESDTPLEPLVEREPIRGGPAGPQVAAELGRLLLRTLRRVRAPGPFVERLRSRFAPRLPVDGGLDPVGRRRLELLASASLDGAALLTALAVDPHTIETMLDDLGVSAGDKRRVLAAADAWRLNADRLFSRTGALLDLERAADGVPLRARDDLG